VSGSGRQLRGWGALALCSAPLAAALLALHVPAAVLLACMVSAMALAVRGTQLAVPRRVFGWGQGLLGCLMAQSLQPRHLELLLPRWPLLLAATLVLIGASTALGWWLMRRQVMPGTTALWGMSPGAAAAMVVLAEQYGADARLVAFMQYTRVLLVTLAAATVARLAGGAHPLAAGDAPWWGAPAWGSLALTAALVLGGSALARRWSIAGGAMVLPLAGAALAQAVWHVQPALPPALMLAAYAAIGWSVGLRFTRAILLHALRALPQVVLSTLALMLVGAATGATLVLAAGVDPLSAFLATGPGGADSMAVIAATSAVDAGFVMAMQLARFLVVLAVGPALTRRLARASGAQPSL